MEYTRGHRQTQVNGWLGNAISTSTNGPSQDVACIEGYTHFWVIESPNGPTSQGTCKLCGNEREFRNSVDSSTWNKGIAKREGS